MPPVPRLKPMMRLYRLHVAEPPLLEPILDVDQLFGKFIKLPMLVGIAVDGEPRRMHAVVGLIGLSPVALYPVVGDRKAAPREQADDFVV